MSFVLGLALPNKIIIKSDGRVISGDSTSILTENYNKTRRISNKLIAGFSGNRSLCELIFNTFLESFRIQSISDDADIAIRSLRDIAMQISKKHPNVPCSFLIGGFNSLGVTTLNSFELLKPNDITYNQVTIDSIAITALEPPELKGQGTSIYKKSLALSGNFIDAMDITITEAASKSFSVNTVIFEQVIHPLTE